MLPMATAGIFPISGKFKGAKIIPKIKFALTQLITKIELVNRILTYSNPKCLIVSKPTAGFTTR